MRSLLFSLILFATIPFILRRPVFGVLVFVWVSVMSPHKLTFGFAVNFPWAMIIAIATFVGILFSREPKHLPITATTVALMMFVAWMNLSTLFAMNPGGAWIQWNKVMKIQLMIFVALYLMHTKEHINALVWVLAGSVGYFGVKGGLFTIMSGGGERVFGPDGFIAENNALALATIMIIPLLRYLHLHAANKWVRHGLLGSMILCLFSVLGSQSRGAFLGLAAMVLMLWLKSRNKFITGLALVIMLPIAIGFMPDKWTNRMQTLETYQEDQSAQGRINAWWMSYNLAKDHPVLGGGFDIHIPENFARYAPDPNHLQGAHSIYFAVLGEHGFVGLGLFLLVWLMLWLDASWINKRVKDLPNLRWAGDLAGMIQVGIVGYMTAGAFLYLAYFDLPYDMLVAVVLTRVLVEKEIRKRGAPSAGYWQPTVSQRQPEGTSPGNGSPAIRRY